MIKVTILGKIKGKARPRFNTRTGRAYTPNDTISYENWIRHCYIEQSNKRLEGAIKARVIIYHQAPKSLSKKKIESLKANIEKDRPNKKPDIDNILKILFDSLNKIAYADDTQIVEIECKKYWTVESERIELELEEI